MLPPRSEPFPILTVRHGAMDLAPSCDVDDLVLGSISAPWNLARTWPRHGRKDFQKSAFWVWNDLYLRRIVKLLGDGRRSPSIA